MESFKSFVNKAAIADLFKKPPKEQINWLDYESSHAAVRKAKTNFLNYNGDFASNRKPKESLKEDEISSNIKWTPWTGRRFKGAELAYNKHHESYDKSHDDPQIVPGDSEDHMPAIASYCSTESEDPDGHSSSSNINNHLRHLAGQRVSKGGEKTQGIYGGHAPERVREAIKALSATFRGNTIRKPIKTFSGVPARIGEQIQAGGHGSVYRNPGFLSTSTQEGTAKEFANASREKHNSEASHVLQLHLHPGSGRSIVHHSPFSEHEILVHHGTRMVYSHTTDHIDGNGHPLKVHHMEVHPDHIPMEEYENYPK